VIGRRPSAKKQSSSRLILTARHKLGFVASGTANTTYDARIYGSARSGGLRWLLWDRLLVLYIYGHPAGLAYGQVKLRRTITEAQHSRDCPPPFHPRAIRRGRGFSIESERGGTHRGAGIEGAPHTIWSWTGGISLPLILDRSIFCPRPFAVRQRSALMPASATTLARLE